MPTFTVSQREALRRNMPTEYLADAAPLPLDKNATVALQQSLLDPELVRSYKYVAEATQETGIRTERDFYFKLEGMNPQIEAINAPLRYGAKYPQVYIPVNGFAKDAITISASHPQYETLLAWSEQAVKRAVQETIASNIAYRMVERVLNTPGQVKRVWPEVIPLLDPASQEVINNASRASRLPMNLTNSDRFWLPHVAHWLTQAALIKSMSSDGPKGAGDDGSYDLDLKERNPSSIMEAVEMGDDSQVGLLS